MLIGSVAAVTADVLLPDGSTVGVEGFGSWLRQLPSAD
jgi:hypothetical protein